MNTFKKSLLALTSATVLGVAVVAVPAAMASDCNSCIEWQRRLEASAQTSTGANLAFPQMFVPAATGQQTTAAGPRHCDAVLAQPSRFANDEVAFCSALNR